MSREPCGKWRKLQVLVNEYIRERCPPETISSVLQLTHTLVVVFYACEWRGVAGENIHRQ